MTDVMEKDIGNVEAVLDEGCISMGNRISTVCTVRIAQRTTERALAKNSRG